MRMLAAVLAFLAAASVVAQTADMPVQTTAGESTELAAADAASDQQASPAADASNDSNDLIVVCPITGVIDEGIKVVVQRAVKEANEKHAAAIFFRVDTPGGRIDSAVEIAKAIDSAKCLTVSYIEGMGAISAGALISFACDKIVMTPGSNMGAAAPVTITAEGMSPLGEKEISFVRGKMRALAESKGHNPDIAQAMVDKDIELRGYEDDKGEYVVFASNPGVQSADDTETDPALSAETPEPPRGAQKSDIVLAKGKLLTVTPNEAAKYGITAATVDNFDEAAIRLVSTKFTTTEIAPNWAEKTFDFLTDPTIAGLLLMLALGGLYFEVKTPGFGLPGIIGVTCLVLLFGSHYVLGLADVLDLLLILVGVTLIAFEVFVIPGFGLAGISGFACLVIGLYLTLTSVAIPKYSWDFDRLADAAWTLVMGVIAFSAFVVVMIRLLPQTPLYRAIVLGTSQDVERGYTIQTAEMATSAIGLVGTTSSMLRPAGKGRFEGRLYDIVSRGDFIERGKKVRIVRAEGNRYVVETVEPEVNA